jgi:hypothetical protein
MAPSAPGLPPPTTTAPGVLAAPGPCWQGVQVASESAASATRERGAEPNPPSNHPETG